jgi:hypothetical protein
MCAEDVLICGNTFIQQYTLAAKKLASENPTVPFVHQTSDKK